jgi:hypothetical protein
MALYKMVVNFKTLKNGINLTLQIPSLYLLILMGMKNTKIMIIMLLKSRLKLISIKLILVITYHLFMMIMIFQELFMIAL